MTETKTTYLKATDGHTIPLYLWPLENPRAIVQISHGMAEHAGRYSDFASYLNQQGYAVIAHDHRGHGLSTPEQQLGIFSSDPNIHGWQSVLNDLHLVETHARTLWPNCPLILLGHSMGAQAARSALTWHKVNSDACILSGLNLNPRIELAAALLVTKLESLRIGRTGKSAIIDKLIFGQFNRQFKPNRTTFDWLSRDDNQVDDYVGDTYCGFRCSNELWNEFLAAMMAMNTKNAISNIDRNLPIFLIGGDQDPATANSKGILKLYDAMTGVGMKRVSKKIWENSRHEIINELNAADVYQSISGWIESQVVDLTT
ncbi:Monoacylglycerol lipase [BD1-7 clade bacterium]|uniref:Monoacylglycerol lipase n=1 Tax=BD1-7 clade bacterium TaxID=2029982 RepID=A0A5S9Q7B3_9GAMM|nr:Monoacylglycerol lipase [BD1-7 clade bacterium]CAA0114671.1 Monoacylglycerol lipase [BD1-7 clade bacterium]